MIKYIYITIILLLLHCELYSQQYWLTQSSPTKNNLRTVFFADSLNGWIGGDSGLIIHTSNKGQSWNVQNSGVDYTILSLFFLNQSTGYALSWQIDNTPPNYYGTRILTTSNGGNNWNNYLFQDTNAFLNTVFYLDSLNGWMGGSGGRLFYTSNSGMNWTQGVLDSGIAFSFPVHKIKFYDTKTGYAAGGAFDIAGMIWKSTNGGRSWQSKIIGPEPVNDFYMNDSLNIIGVGGDFEYGSSNVRTSNAGSNWLYTELGVFGIANSIGFRTETEAWTSLGIVDSFLVSTNSGNNWRLTGTPDGAQIYNLYFADHRNGWAVGNNGVILKYNSEMSGISPVNNSIPESITLKQNYPNPFNPKTIINYQLSMFNSVQLKIYNILGDEVITLVDMKQSPGNYSVDWDAANSPSGIYFYSLFIDGIRMETKSMVLVK